MAERHVFPLVSRRRLAGLEFGTERSSRRGPGSDVAGSRPYRLGDNVSTIDWRASARLSSARGRDEFVVRTRFAEDAPRVVVVCDRRPAMGIYGPDLPWLSKPAALAEATDAIVASAVAARGLVGYLDAGAGPDGSENWLPPGGPRGLWRIEQLREEAAFDGPEDSLERSLAFLERVRRTLPPGTFVFLLSDFLAPPRAEAWFSGAAARWNLVPVVIQDPVWEASFPPVSSVVVPLADPGSGRVADVRLTRAESERLRRANEGRLRDLLDDFATLDLDPVPLGSSAPQDVDRAFLDWADLRAGSRRVLAS